MAKESLQFIPEKYRDYHEAHLQDIAETPKRLCYDEYHRTSRSHSVRAQLIRDVREGRKRGVQIGYLTAERAPRISQLIRQGRELRAVFQADTTFGSWIRVAFDGREPSLPREAAPVEPDEGWFSDESWPDDD